MPTDLLGGMQTTRELQGDARTFLPIINLKGEEKLPGFIEQYWADS